MRVLSLFDGIACGKVALDRAGIPIEVYYSSEVDKHAMKVASSNHPQIIQLGDVTKINFSELSADLVIGGSPCTSFSTSGKMQGFDGESKLFWEFVRAIDEVQPKYFLLENVKMKKEWQDIISNSLGVQPILVNSSLVSAQNRERLYWTNIPGFVQPEDRGIVLKDILEDLPFTEPPYEEKYQSCKPIPYTSNKFRTLRASAGSKTRGIGVCNETGWWRKLTVAECEILQTLPVGYTSSISPAQAYKALGNGWTVDVIVEFFKNLK